MMILTIRTDKPEAEIGLFEDQSRIAYETWQAHRRLAETIHQKIAKLLDDNKYVWSNLEGIVVYQGPGSFTGLRIGISTVNALAYGLQIPLVTTQSNWVERGIERLLAHESDGIALPEYGTPVHITMQKK